MRKLLLLFGAIGISAALQGQAVFEARVGSGKVAADAVFELSFVLENADGSSLKMPSFRPFRQAGYIQESHSTEYINGRSREAHIWSLQLRAPEQPGTYTIGSAQIMVNGKWLKSSPINIRVVESSDPGLSKSQTDEGVFVRAEFAKDTVYVGQQAIYRLVLYTRKTIAGYDIIDLPEVDKAFIREIKRYDTRTNEATINGQRYATKTLFEMAIFPQVAGEVPVDRAMVKVGVEQSGTLGMLMGAKPLNLPVEPSVLYVQPLPIPAPKGFSGGVGQYIWDVEVDQDVLTTDDAATLRLSIRGNGDMRRFSPPRIQAPAGLEVFPPQEEEREEFESGTEVMHTLKLNYALVPKKEGSYTINPELIVFDPDSARYVHLQLDQAIELHVSKGSRTEEDFTSTQRTFDGDSFFPTAVKNALESPWIYLLLLIPLGWFFYLWQKNRKKASRSKESDQTQIPGTRTSESQQLHDLKASMDQGRSKAFYESAYRLLQTHLNEHWGLSTSQLNKEQLRERMALRGAPDSLHAEVHQLLQTCEQALYAGMDKSAEMPRVYEQIRQLLH
ncbi:MAG: BatD family protein [Saprospiraceae bacterium]